MLYLIDIIVYGIFLKSSTLWWNLDMSWSVLQMPILTTDYDELMLILINCGARWPGHLWWHLTTCWTSRFRFSLSLLSLHSSGIGCTVDSGVWLWGFTRSATEGLARVRLAFQFITKGVKWGCQKSKGFLQITRVLPNQPCQALATKMHHKYIHLIQGLLLSSEYNWSNERLILTWTWDWHQSSI